MKNILLILLAFFIGCSTHKTKKTSSTKNKQLKKITLKEDITTYTNKINIIIDSLIKIDDPRLKRNKNGDIIRPNDISPSGKPIYFEKSHGDNLFSSVKAGALKEYGSLGLNLYGKGVVVGVWDYGAILVTHDEFTNPSTGANVIDLDTNEPQNIEDNHPTSVTSCIYAQGVFHNENYDFEGLAPNVDKLIYRNWDDRDLEILISLDANPNFVLSNHSYGFPIKRSDGVFQYEASEIGVYGNRDKTLDNNANSYPYYLHVTSAGNEGDLEAYQSGSPLQYEGQEFKDYDLLTSGTLAKNILTVGSISNQLSIFGTTVPSVFSSSGPADDGRVKPEIVARGESIPVARALDNDGNQITNGYSSASGTSFSSPITTGGLVLLQELYKNYNQNFMLSSTLKGLVCHTADDVTSWNGYEDIIGPDPKTGYGLLNLEKAATLIMNDSAVNSLNIQELDLNDGEELSFSFTQTDSNEPFIASISWTDPAKTEMASTIDLVNDLDVRIEKDGVVYLPWKLDAASKNQAAIKGDNLVDNFEKIELQQPELGTYLLTISHKGTIEGTQKVSLIVSGNGYLTLGNQETNSLSLEKTVIVYYNKIKDKLIVQSILAENTIIGLEIYSLNGRLINKSTFQDQKFLEVDTSNFESSIYFAKIQTKNGALTHAFLIN